MAWQLIETFDRPDREKVDVWMAWGASALTMGMADSFMLEGGAWRVGGKWFHEYKGREAELQSDYVVMWAPFGEQRDRPDPWEELQERREYERLQQKFSQPNVPSTPRAPEDT